MLLNFYHACWNHMSWGLLQAEFLWKWSAEMVQQFLRLNTRWNTLFYLHKICYICFRVESLFKKKKKTWNRGDAGMVFLASLLSICPGLAKVPACGVAQMTCSLGYSSAAKPCRLKDGLVEAGTQICQCLPWGGRAGWSPCECHIARTSSGAGRR